MTRSFRSLVILVLAATPGVRLRPRRWRLRLRARRLRPHRSSRHRRPAAARPNSRRPSRPARSGWSRSTTANGPIGITIEADLSPIAAGNFVALAECGYYDGVVFHRVATLPDGTPFVIQGGDPTGTGTGGPGYTIKDEPVTATYGRGTVAMARTQDPNSVGSQFFIVLDDKDREVLASANTYQIIGTVTDGHGNCRCDLCGSGRRGASERSRRHG